jgi:hypothetical protein
MYEPGADKSYWTPDYACCYILAPFVGAFLAGNVFGYQKILYTRIEFNLHEEESEEEPEQLKGKPKKVMKLHKARKALTGTS